MPKTTHVDQLKQLGLKNPIRRHLIGGKSVRETARLLKISTVRVYEYANTHSLPTNKPIAPGSSHERQILDLLRSRQYPLKIIASILRISPSILLSLKQKIRKSRP
jgi:hypothetical protein